MNRNRKPMGICSTNVSRRAFLKAAGGIGLLGTVSAAFPWVTRAEPKEIEVAFIQPMSGPMVPIASGPTICAHIAVDEINASGGIRSLGGAKLKLVEYDNEGKPEVGASMVERAARSDAIAIIGSMQSGVVMVQTLVAERNRIPNIVDVAIADDITARNLRYVFQTCPSTEQMIFSDLSLIRSLQDQKTGKKVKTLGVMYEDTAYGQSVFTDIKNHHSNFGFELVSSISYNWKSADLTPFVTRMKAANPDFIYVCGYIPDTILIIKTIYSLKLTPLGIHGCANGVTEEFYEGAKPYGDYLFYGDWWSPDIIPGAPKDRGQKLIEEFKKRAGGKILSGEGIKTLSAFFVLKEAIEKAADRNRDKLRDALEGVYVTGAQGSALPYPIKFDAKHRVEGAFSVVGQWLNGKRATVYPKEVATAKLVFPQPSWKDRGL